jgi:hypothetical protein
LQAAREAAAKEAAAAEAANSAAVHAAAAATAATTASVIEGLAGSSSLADQLLALLQQQQQELLQQQATTAASLQAAQEATMVEQVEAAKAAAAKEAAASEEVRSAAARAAAAAAAASTAAAIQGLAGSSSLADLLLALLQQQQEQLVEQQQPATSLLPSALEVAPGVDAQLQHSRHAADDDARRPADSGLVPAELAEDALQPSDTYNAAAAAADSSSADAEPGAVVTADTAAVVHYAAAGVTDSGSTDAHPGTLETAGSAAAAPATAAAFYSAHSSSIRQVSVSSSSGSSSRATSMHSRYSATEASHGQAVAVDGLVAAAGASLPLAQTAAAVAAVEYNMGTEAAALQLSSSSLVSASAAAAEMVAAAEEAVSTPAVASAAAAVSAAAAAAASAASVALATASWTQDSVTENEAAADLGLLNPAGSAAQVETLIDSSAEAEVSQAMPTNTEVPAAAGGMQEPATEYAAAADIGLDNLAGIAAQLQTLDDGPAAAAAAEVRKPSPFIVEVPAATTAVYAAEVVQPLPTCTEVPAATAPVYAAPGAPGALQEAATNPAAVAAADSSPSPSLAAAEAAAEAGEAAVSSSLSPRLSHAELHTPTSLPLVLTAEASRDSDYFRTPSAAAPGSMMALAALPETPASLLPLAAMASSSSVHGGAPSPLDSALLHLAGAALQYLEAELSQASTVGATAAAAAAGTGPCLLLVSGSECIGSINDGAWGEEDEELGTRYSGDHWGFSAEAHEDGSASEHATQHQQQQQQAFAAAEAPAADEPASPLRQQYCGFFAPLEGQEDPSGQAALDNAGLNSHSSPALFATPTATPVGQSRTRQASSGLAALMLCPAGNAAAQQQQQPAVVGVQQPSLSLHHENSATGGYEANTHVADAAEAFMSFHGSSRTAAAWAGAAAVQPAAESISSSMLPSLMQRWLSRTAEESDAESNSSSSSQAAAEAQQEAASPAAASQAEAAAAAAAASIASWSSPDASTTSSTDDGLQQQRQLPIQQQQQQQRLSESPSLCASAGTALAPSCIAGGSSQLAAAATVDEGFVGAASCSSSQLEFTAAALVAPTDVISQTAEPQESMLQHSVATVAAEQDGSEQFATGAPSAAALAATTPALAAACTAAASAVLSTVMGAIQQPVLLTEETAGEEFNAQPAVVFLTCHAPPFAAVL